MDDLWQAYDSRVIKAYSAIPPVPKGHLMSQTLFQATYARLRSDIIFGVAAPGQRLRLKGVASTHVV